MSHETGLQVTGGVPATCQEVEHMISYVAVGVAMQEAAAALCMFTLRVVVGIQ